MLPTIYLAYIRWEGVEGATGYEIWKDGVRVSTAGPKARTTRVSVDDATVVTIVDLPARSREQTIDFAQVTG